METLTLVQAFILGVVEGITEFLPISSTGHLILTSHFLGLTDPITRTPEQIAAIEAFEIVIQSGAILAVFAVYLTKIKLMLNGLMGKSEEGKKLFINIMSALVPTLVIGFLFNKIIKAFLMNEKTAFVTMLFGGLVMVRWSATHWYRDSRNHGKSLNFLVPRTAFIIGLVQCIAMIPGTSRSMVTLLGGMMLGLSPVAAAEFSFLLGLPTLFAATVFKGYKEGANLNAQIPMGTMAMGLIVSAIVAFLSVKWLLSYLNRKGLSAFGWYRIVMGTALLLYFSRIS